MTATTERPAAPERPPRSVPKVNFTDAEAGAKEFPDSGASARRYNYYVPAKRKQTHYEDVTVEVQPDPRHYLSQGWIYGFADGQTGYPLTWTKLKAWGVDEPEPERGIGTGGGGKDLHWPAHGWHEFRDPNEEWEQTIYRNNANIVRQLNQNIENARNAKSFEQWTRNWITFVERSVGAWMHVEHVLGLYVFARQRTVLPDEHAQHAAGREQRAQDPVRPGPGAVQPHPQRGDRELRRRRARRRLEQRSRVAGVREIVEALTAIEDDWGEAMFVTNVIFEPLIGELFRSRLVMHAAPGNGDFVTPTVMGAGESDYAQRDLAWTKACFGPLVHDREFADHNRQLMDGWLSAWVPRVLTAARTMQPLWSTPDHRPPRFEDSLEHVKNRFAGILSDLGLETPKELAQ